MALEPERSVDVLIVGNGPAALILSFILHGNIPYYNIECPHPDPILHAKLKQNPCLLQLDVDELTAHFDASRISYSTQALPVNVLLDTLLRPLADVVPGEYRSAVVWRKQPEKAVSHLIVGQSAHAGGQWAEGPVSTGWDIGALSYIDQLSLPGYGLYDHLKTIRKSLSCTTERPTRQQLAEYFAAYPAVVGIEQAIRCSTIVSDVHRVPGGFLASAPDRIRCRQLVLASGIFTQLLTPPPELTMLAKLEETRDVKGDGAILVVGSGFSAADVIISHVRKRRILHIYKWQPDDRPSPLKGCHPQAYPDYAGVYRQMKEAARQQPYEKSAMSPAPRKSNPFFEDWVWKENYEGMPNAVVRNAEIQNDMALVTFEAPDGRIFSRQVASLAYVTGRQGSLGFLDAELQDEVLDETELKTLDPFRVPLDAKSNQPISGRTLRDQTMLDVEVAKDVFAVGSLTGDSLIRFAYGSCVQAAGHIVSRVVQSEDVGDRASSHQSCQSRALERRPTPERYDDAYHLTGGHDDLDKRGNEKGVWKSDDDDDMPSSKCCRGLGKCVVQ